VVRIEEIPEPKLTDDEVVLEVRSAGLNHLDIWVRKGRGDSKLTEPHILGSDAAGIVIATGSRVRDVSVGDEVILNPGLSCGCCENCNRGEQSECISFGIVGLSRPGTFAEQVAVPARNVAPKPSHLSFNEAGAFVLAQLTAWRMLMTRAQLKPGQTVSANTALLSIVEIDPIIAVIFVPERDYARLRVGQSVSLTTDAFPDERFEARIGRIAPVFKPGSRQARVEVVVDNPEQRLKPGLFILTTIQLDRVDNATIVPQAALAKRGAATGVFLVDADGPIAVSVGRLRDAASRRAVLSPTGDCVAVHVEFGPVSRRGQRCTDSRRLLFHLRLLRVNSVNHILLGRSFKS